MDSLDARVISKFPLSPSSAGTRMKTSVTFWKTSQCYKMNTESKNFSNLKGLALKLNRMWGQGTGWANRASRSQHMRHLIPHPHPQESQKQNKQEFQRAQNSTSLTIFSTCFCGDPTAEPPQAGLCPRTP